MRRLPLTIAILLAAAAAAHAQGRKDGMSSEEKPLAGTIKLHYVASSETQAQAIKMCLEKVKGVSGVTFIPSEYAVTLTYEGRMKDLPALESAAMGSGGAAYLVSHAVTQWTFKPEKGAIVDAFFNDLDKTEGIINTGLNGGLLWIMGELGAYAFDDVVKLGEKHKIKIEAKSHELVDIAVVGENSGYVESTKAINMVKGLALVKLDEQTGIYKCIGVKKQATDDAIKKALDKTKMKLGKIDRK